MFPIPPSVFPHIVVLLLHPYHGASTLPSHNQAV
jgi:hypothetical protein